jgi:alpha-glucosidase
MFQTLGLSGEAFVGADIPGFQDGRADGELASRWYQVGFLAPFCRNHQIRGGYDHEPFRYPARYRDIIRKYLKLRYRMLPYLYTVLEEAHRTGEPMFRPLVLDYQSDENVVDLDNQFLVGHDLLVAPVVTPRTSHRSVYLPEGGWVDYWTRKRVRGGDFVEASAPLDIVPMFLREGSIVPLGPEMNFVGEKPLDPLTLIASADEQGLATGTLYEDDGESQEYQKGASRTLRFTVRKAGNRSVLQIASSGRLAPTPRRIIVELDGESHTIQWDGKATEVELP